MAEAETITRSYRLVSPRVSDAFEDILKACPFVESYKIDALGVKVVAEITFVEGRTTEMFLHGFLRGCENLGVTVEPL